MSIENYEDYLDEEALNLAAGISTTDDDVAAVNEVALYKDNNYSICLDLDENRNYGSQAYFKVYKGSKIDKSPVEIRLHVFDNGYEVHNGTHGGKPLWNITSKQVKDITKILNGKCNNGEFKKSDKSVFDNIVDELVKNTDYTIPVKKNENGELVEQRPTVPDYSSV